MSELEDKFKNIEAKDVVVNIKGSKLVLRHNDETKLINVMSGNLGNICCNIDGDVLGHVNGIVFGSFSTINKGLKMKDREITMGESKVILSYNEKTKLISVWSSELGDIVGNVISIVGDVGNVDGYAGYVSGHVGNVVGDVGNVMGHVGNVCGSVGHVMEGK